jgi:hypothetical protein
MMANDPTRHFFSVLHDLYDISDGDLSAHDPQTLLARIRGIHKGLSAEHEFAAIASWLGDPRLIIHADEVLATDKHFGVPDFLTVVQGSERDIAFLVEVKEEKDDRIKWSEKYFTAPKRFAALLNLPLLLAWKRFGMWALSDTELFEKMPVTGDAFQTRSYARSYKSRGTA